MLFNAIGEGEPQQEVPTFEPKPIRYFSELNLNTFHPTILKPLKERDQQTTRDFKTKSYIAPTRHEGNVEIKDTDTIEKFTDKRELTKKKEGDTQGLHAFEKVINFKTKKEGAFETITFDTKQYFNEAHRIAKNPKLLLDSKTNPIMKYVPTKDKEEQCTLPHQHFQFIHFFRQKGKVQRLRREKTNRHNSVHKQGKDAEAVERKIILGVVMFS